jgi:hypothetical protein
MLRTHHLRRLFTERDAACHVLSSPRRILSPPPSTFLLATAQSPHDDATYELCRQKHVRRQKAQRQNSTNDKIPHATNLSAARTASGATDILPVQRRVHGSHASPVRLIARSLRRPICRRHTPSGDNRNPSQPHDFDRSASILSLKMRWATAVATATKVSSPRNQPGSIRAASLQSRNARRARRGGEFCPFCLMSAKLPLWPTWPTWPTRQKQAFFAHEIGAVLHFSRKFPSRPMPPSWPTRPAPTSAIGIQPRRARSDKRPPWSKP